MRANGIVGRVKRRFRRTTDSNHANPIAPNVLRRDFATSAPDTVWVGDVTYIATGEGWTYLAVLLDLFSRRIVGWAIREHTDLASLAFRRTVNCRRFLLAGLVHHTDRGSPYASENDRKALTEHARREHEQERRLLGRRRGGELLRHGQTVH